MPKGTIFSFCIMVSSIYGVSNKKTGKSGCWRASAAGDFFFMIVTFYAVTTKRVSGKSTNRAEGDRNFFEKFENRLAPVA